MSNSANYLQYGPIKINLVNVKECKREPIYADKEQTHYLYTRHTLLVDGVIAQDNEIIYGVQEVANDAIKIDVIIRHFLTQPRLQLYYVVGGVTLLSSPEQNAPGYLSIDCTNGPKPKGLNITRINGVNSIQVSFSIQTDINDAHDFGAPKYAILSNSYTMEHIIDQDYYTARKVAGLIIFRTDVMFDNGISPDDFRELVNIPTPITMKRDIVKCRLHPGSMRLEYSFIDRETHFHLDTGSTGKTLEPGTTIPLPNMANITRLEITQSVTNMQPTPYFAVQDAFAHASKITGATGVLSPFAIVGNLTSAMGAMLPVNEEHLGIQVYGNNLSDKHQLEYLLYYLVSKKLPYSRSAGKYTFKLEIDAMGSYARIQVSRTSSPIEVADYTLVANNQGWVGDMVTWLTGAKTNQDIHNKFLDASVIFTGNKFDLNRLHNKSFFAQDFGKGSHKEGVDGVYLKTYVNGQLNPSLIDLEPISARSGMDQMRGTFLEQIFVEGIRSNPTESPVDPHQNAHEYYHSKNSNEQHLGSKAQ